MFIWLIKLTGWWYHTFFIWSNRAALTQPVEAERESVNTFFNLAPGEMIQFDEHTFRVGWFNHQAAYLVDKSEGERLAIYTYLANG